MAQLAQLPTTNTPTVSNRGGGSIWEIIAAAVVPELVQRTFTGLGSTVDNDSSTGFVSGFAGPTWQQQAQERMLDVEQTKANAPKEVATIESDTARILQGMKGDQEKALGELSYNQAIDVANIVTKGKLTEADKRAKVEKYISDNNLEGTTRTAVMALAGLQEKVEADKSIAKGNQETQMSISELNAAVATKQQELDEILARLNASVGMANVEADRYATDTNAELQRDIIFNSPQADSLRTENLINTPVPPMSVQDAFTTLEGGYDPTAFSTLKMANASNPKLQTLLDRAASGELKQNWLQRFVDPFTTSPNERTLKEAIGR
jgi:hypothetical protein